MNLSPKTAAALALLVVGIMAQTAFAQKCDCCGKGGDCCTVCVLECYEKEVEIVCWKCECEDFCLPGPCCLGCKNVCDPCCGGKGGKGGCKGGSCQKGGACQKGGCGLFGGCCGKLFCWKDECPGDCPSHHCRKKLYRKIEVVKVPAYRWVVQSCCGKCEGKIQGAEVAPGDDIPAPPPVEAAKYKYRIQATPVSNSNESVARQLADVIAR